MEKLIFKYLNDSLTEEELNTLQEWLIKDKENIKEINMFDNIVTTAWSNIAKNNKEEENKNILQKMLHTCKNNTPSFIADTLTSVLNPK